MSDTKRRMLVYYTISKLEESGIRCCVLKGDAVARFYYKPDYRISSDTDILIDMENEKKAAEVLGMNGFDVTERPAWHNHFVAKHPSGAIIEMHVSLNNEIFDKMLFNNINIITEKYHLFETNDGFKFNTLGITDGFIFTTLHFIQHFLYKGAGIRQLMDTLLYAEYYQDKIDWERFYSLLSHLKYKKFFENIVGIGVTYLGFQPNALPKSDFSERLMVGILEDMEDGGVFGYGDKNRESFSKIYSEERYNRFNKGNYHTYIKAVQKRNYWKEIFPNKEWMSINFPYVKRFPFLLPVAWFNRDIALIIGVLKKRKSISQYVKYANAEANNASVRNRMNLIRELDMI